MTKRRTFSRRALLGAAGGASLAVPWLEALTGRKVAQAATMPSPQRLIVFFTPGGTIRDQFWPTGTETNFTLPYILQPLQSYQQNLLILDGIDLKPMLDGVGQAHQKGMGGLLTGRALPPGQFAFFSGGAGFPAGMSIDQAIGAQTGGATKFKTLEFGVIWPTYGSGSLPQNIISYSAAAQPAPPMADPYAAFMRLFADVGASAQQAIATAARAKKTRLVLDAATTEFSLLRPTLGVADQRRIDEHLSRLHDIASGLDAPTGMTNATCLRPDLSAADSLSYMTGDGDSHLTIAQDISARMPKIGQQMMDMMVMSFACDLTRVASIEWTDAASRASFPWLGLNENHHFYQHDGGFQQMPCATICNWFMQQLAYLVKRLAETPEGDHTLLDSTVIFVASEIADPPSHDYRRMPFMLINGSKGPFRTGRYLKFNGLPHNNLLVSLENAFNIQSATFGDPKYCTGPLTGLV